MTSWGINEEVWVSEELGIMMISKGLLLADKKSAYVSTFVKVPNPLSSVNLCNIGCGGDMEPLDARMYGLNCTEGRSKRGIEKVSDSVFRVLEYEGKMSVERARDRNVRNWCFLECLKEDKCEAFGVNGDLCLLRQRVIDVENMIECQECGEWSVDCLTNGNRTKVCEEFMAGDQVNLLMLRDNERFVKGNWERLNQLIETNERKRKKRSMWDFLGGGAVGFLATGFSFFEMNEIKGHVEQLREDYNDFKRKQVAFNKDQVNFNKQILMIHKGLVSETQKELAALHCRVDSLGFHILNTRRLMEWKDYLYQLYKDILGGGMVGSISTLIFTKENIEMIIQESALLQGTIYEEDPVLAYRLGTMSIVQNSITEESFVVHVVLKLPIIKREELKVIFEVKQTGVRHNKGCVKYGLPKNVYRHHEKFYVLDSPMCSMVANVQLCSASINSTVVEMPCVTDMEGCEVEEEQCKTQIVQSVAGLLVRSDEEVRTSTLRQPDIFEREKPSENTVMFYNYSEFADVLVGAVKIRGIMSTTLEKVIKLPSPRSWLEILKNRTEVKLSQNVSMLMETIRRQEIVVKQLKDEAVIFGKGKWWVTPVVLTSMAIIGSMIVWMCKELEWSWQKCTKCCREFRSQKDVKLSDTENVTYEKLRRGSECEQIINEKNPAGDKKTVNEVETEKEREVESKLDDREADIQEERKIYKMNYPEAVPARVTKPSRRRNE